MMKLAQLPLYLSTDEAETIIAFLDQLRSLLTNHYADDIQRMHHAQLPAESELEPEINWRDLEDPNELLF